MFFFLEIRIYYCEHRGHSDSHQSKKDSDSHPWYWNYIILRGSHPYAARTHNTAARTTFAYSLTLRPARLAPAGTRTTQWLAPFFWWIREKTRAARTTQHLAPLAPYSLTLQPARLAPAGTRTTQWLAPFFWWVS